MAAPTFVDVENDPDTAGGNGNNISFAWADITGEATDHLAICALYKESTAAYTATPSGANQVSGFPVDQSTGGFKYRADLWWYRVPASPATLTWTWSGGTWRFGRLVLYSGLINSETPIINASQDNEGAQDTQPNHPGITIARTDSGLLWVTWNFSGSTGIAPSGYTQRLATEGSPEILAFDDLSTTPGASGATGSANLADPEYALSCLMEIATVAGGAAPKAKIITHRPTRIWTRSIR